MPENKDPIKEIAKGAIKKKVLLILLPAISVLLIILVVLALGILILHPILVGGQLVEGAAGVWERLTNTLTLKCFFCTDQDVKDKKEEKFYKKVDKLNETYLSGKNMEGTSIQLDIPLLLSALFYTDDIENTVLENVDSVDTEGMEDATSGDLFGDLSWYADESDQERIKWYQGATEADGCYILGYYYSSDHTPLTASKLRKLAKHMVKRTRNGTCTATHDEEGNFTGWSISEWYEFTLDIDRTDDLYSMEYDQNPYKTYRDKSEIGSLPPTFITYLIAKYLPNEYDYLLPTPIKDLSEAHRLYLNNRKEIKNVMYSYKDAYEYLVGHEYGSGAICGAVNGNCTYSVKNIDNKTVNVSNLKVKLLQCGDEDRGKPIVGEELVDFEKYITGVVYAENGGAPYEALKAQAIAARSYALMRGEKMGTKYLKIYQENGQWILPIRNCTEDQVYCDPDTGCSAVRKPSASGSATTIYSGANTKSYTYKGPLAADSDIRKAVAETTGKVLTDSSGKIFYASYTQTEQTAWNTAAKAGSDAYQALVSTYGSSNILKATCSGNVGTTTNTGSEKYYYQYDYSYVPYCSGDATVATSGCLPTAFAMSVENLTGKVTTPQEIAEYICNDTNGSKKYRVVGSGTSSGFLLDQATQSQFHVSTRTIPVSERNIDNILKILKSGKNIIVSVKGTGTFATESGHFIVLSSVTAEGKVKVLDPGHKYATKDYTTAVIQTEVLNKINTGMWEISSTGSSVSSDGCYTGATGDYIGWRQFDKTWGSIPLGSGGATIKSAGCLATSVAKIITMSGTQTTINSFNPGTMVKYLNTHGGFSGSNWIWDSPKNSGLAPNFVHGGSVSLKGKSESEKIATVKRYLDQGYYLVLQVKCDGTEEPGQHWVAVLGVTNDDIVMSDPASDKTTVWSKYKSGGTVQFHYYKKTD